MSIDELIKKATIDFPRALNLEEAEKLINHLAENLPARIDYTITSNKMIIVDPGEEIFKQEGTVKITANITHSTKPNAFDSCEFNPHGQDSSKLSSMKFQLTPGWELSDYRPEVQQLWEDVRKVVTYYLAFK